MPARRERTGGARFQIPTAQDGFIAHYRDDAICNFRIARRRHWKYFCLLSLQRAAELRQILTVREDRELIQGLTAADADFALQLRPVLDHVASCRWRRVARGHLTDRACTASTGQTQQSQHERANVRHTSVMAHLGAGSIGVLDPSRELDYQGVP